MAITAPFVLQFTKTGAEIKQALQRRIIDLEQRLATRNAALDSLLNDKARLRAYLVRQPNLTYGHSRQAPVDVPSEDHQEIMELCRRISVIEGDLARLRIIQTHLKDEQEFALNLDQLLDYGFNEQPG
jgi:hypothetical protein